MSRRNIGWLLGELPRLVEAGVLSADTAAAIRRHYEAEGPEARSSAVNLFAILGSTLVGGGLILLVAHNWDALSRAARTVLALVPLAAAQLLAARTLASGRTSAAWREGVGIFWTLAMGAALALIGQTYHLPADFDVFLLTWMLLSLPVVYLLGASLPALVYLAGVVGWGRFAPGEDLWIWPLIGLAVPHLALLARRRPSDAWESVVAWAIALAATAASAMTLVEGTPVSHSWLLAFAGLFAAFYLAPGTSARDEEARWRRVFHTIGALGGVLLAGLMTYEFPWVDLGRPDLVETAALSSPRSWLVGGLSLALFAGAGLLLLRRLGHLDRGERLIGALPLVTGLGYGAAAFAAAPTPAKALFNLYVFAIGLVLTLDGVRRRQRGRANGGMAILAALILARFFDTELSFVVRGLAFIAIGVAFLLLNAFLHRRERPAE